MLDYPMTDDVAAAFMRKYSECGDCEEAHRDADELLCNLLLALGYPKTVQAFEEMGKWYA